MTESQAHQSSQTAPGDGPAGFDDGTLLRNLFEAAPVGAVLCDPSGAIVSWNREAAALLGGAGTPCPAGESVFALLPELEEPTGAEAAEAIAGAGEWRARYKGASSYGTALNCDVAIRTLTDGAGRTWWCAYFSDISEQAALHESLMQSEKLSALGEIVAGVAHELNNPLTGILGYAQLVMAAVEDEKTHNRVDQIAMEASRCRQIVQSLLGFSRHSGSEKSAQNFNDLVNDMLVLREYQMRVDNVTIELELDGHLPPVELDRHEMQRVILNILNNAHEALARKDGGDRRLTIESRGEGEWVRLTFTDNGPGIPPQHLGKVFDPFFSTKDVGEGTGLGLSVAYGVVRDHGGELRVESTPGNGAAFSIVLPASTQSGT